jgi:hypothetical protein
MRKNARQRDNFPNRPDDNERKNIARNQAQTLAALRTGAGHGDRGDGILHRSLFSSRELGQGGLSADPWVASLSALLEG